MRKHDWESVQDTNTRIPAGGYVAAIVDCRDNPNKEYLEVIFDIQEGEFAGYYSDDFGDRNPWAHHFFRSYKDECEGMFKGFLSVLERSNPGFSIARWQVNSDERELIGLTIGLVLGTEIYDGNDGRTKERLEVVAVKDADAIRSGDFTVPEPKDSRGGTGAAGISPRATVPGPVPRSAGVAAHAAGVAAPPASPSAYATGVASAPTSPAAHAAASTSPAATAAPSFYRQPVPEAATAAADAEAFHQFRQQSMAIPTAPAAQPTQYDPRYDEPLPWQRR